MAKPLAYRFKADDVTGFDELVVKSGKPNGVLIHAEMMDERGIFVSVGDVRIWAYINKKGEAVVTGIENNSDVDAPSTKDRK